LRDRRPSRADSSDGIQAMRGVVLVTGGGRGIGAATARLAAACSYAVCVNYAHDQDAAPPW
jgi:NAD(P)-dependent dehydrogenase (short-subunit alcohol dehydrogenase family)